MGGIHILEGGFKRDFLHLIITSVVARDVVPVAAGAGDGEEPPDRGDCSEAADGGAGGEAGERDGAEGDS